MGWLDRLFRRDQSDVVQPTREVRSPPTAPLSAVSVDSEERPAATIQRHDLGVSGWRAGLNDDVLEGYQFAATLQLRTPLRVLREHGRVHRGATTPPPQLTTAMWEGIWVPKTRSWRELGVDLVEPESTHASHAGPVSPSEYLPFLVAVRSEVEREGKPSKRRTALSNLLRRPEHKRWAEKLGGPEAILDQFFPSFLSTLPGLSQDGRAALKALGAETPSQISARPDAALLAVPSIGAARLKAIRKMADEAADPEDTYVDLVAR